MLTEILCRILVSQYAKLGESRFTVNNGNRQELSVTSFIQEVIWNPTQNRVRLEPSAQWQGWNRFFPDYARVAAEGMALGAGGNGPQSRRAMLVEMARKEDLTIRQLALRVTGARGHLIVIGTASNVADEMERWFRSGAADGFNVMPAHLPGGLTEFVETVVPELQKRGLFRKSYETGTLRDRLGLTRPVRSAPAAQAADQ